MIDIKGILQSIGIPIEHLFYQGKATTYAVYQIYNENGEAFAEDKEIETSYFIQVDIYSKEDLTDIYKQALDIMLSIGCYRKYSTEMYEPATKLNHKVIRFQYTESSQT